MPYKGTKYLFHGHLTDFTNHRRGVLSQHQWNPSTNSSCPNSQNSNPIPSLGEMWPVINLKQLNKWPTFQNGGYSDLLKTGDWMVKVDLKDAYFTTPNHKAQKQYLRFQVAEVCYQFTWLPFGLPCAPWTFTKVMKPLMTLLRSWGVRIIVYINDMLILANSKEVAMQHLKTLMFLLKVLGFMINPEKSRLCPCWDIEFLGLQGGLPECVSLGRR